MDDGTAADELLATCWTTAGDAAPSRQDRRSPVRLRGRIEAASAAGFTGFGVLAVDLAVAVAVAVAEREHAWSGIRTMLADNGIVHLELERPPDWWSGGPERARSDGMRRFLLRPAEALGARHHEVTSDPSGAPWDPGHRAAEFALLVGQAADAGARPGIEFMPWTDIRTVHDGLRLVEDAGHPAGGTIVDAWHVDRAGTPAAELAALPPHRIVGVEFGDADREVVGTLFEDTVAAHRRLGRPLGRRDPLHGAPSARRQAGRRAGRHHRQEAARDHRRPPVTPAVHPGEPGAERRAGRARSARADHGRSGHRLVRVGTSGESRGAGAAVRAG